MRVLLVSANREVLPSPVVPLGPITVAAGLRPAHEVELVDLCFEEDPLAALEARIAAFSPEVVGIGLRNLHTSTEAGTDALLGYYRDVVDAVRRTTGAPVVLGGAAFSLRPRAMLDALGADHGVVGEGERAFPALCAALEAGDTPPRIVQGSVHAERTLPSRPRAARDLVDPRYYELEGTDNLQTKRGCAFECAYCDYPDVEGRRVRLRDPADVADEAAARAQAPGVSHFFIVDSVFNSPRSHALAVAGALTARSVRLPWVCYATPRGFDGELAEAMARAGCAGVEIGSDTGTARGLALLRKPFDLADIRRTSELCAAQGIRDCHTFVLGALDETVDDVKETLDFIDALSPRVAVFCVFMEDREERTVGRARHREAILALLAAEAPKRRGWVVPELSIRFGPKLTRIVRQRKLRGPSWLHLAG